MKIDIAVYGNNLMGKTTLINAMFMANATDIDDGYECCIKEYDDFITILDNIYKIDVIVCVIDESCNVNIDILIILIEQINENNILYQKNIKLIVVVNKIDKLDNYTIS